MPPVTTVTFAHFPTGAKWSGFSAMRDGPKELRDITGVRFSRMMGSGKGIGFDPRPNFHVYVILLVWDDVEAMHRFFSGPWFARYTASCDAVFTVVQYPMRSRGAWAGSNPFEPSTYPTTAPGAPPLRAVITRATIRLTQLVRFWRSVPESSAAVSQAAGRLFSVGIGEAPLIQQATYSLWESDDAIQQFAYRGAAHRKVISDTHTYNWYSEELFVRFVPVATIGSWPELADLTPYGITSFPELPQLSALQEATSLPA